MGFVMTTESQDLGLTSHPKDGLLSIVLEIITLFIVTFDQFNTLLNECINFFKTISY